ncbi:MAG: flagellar hook assembly protein FlgD [Pseudomonadota bacterium]
MTTVNTKDVYENIGLSTKPKSTAKEMSAQDQFLQLMLAQLKNQDPFKPMENGEFLTQMAQFESAAGIKDLQKSMDSIAVALQSNQALQASSLVGKSAMVPNGLNVLGSAGMRGGIELDQSSGRVVLSIEDKAGQLVKRVELGPQQAGLFTFTWDGTDMSGKAMPHGVYKIKAEAWHGTKAEAARTFAISSVDSVNIGRSGEGISLNLTGLGSWSLDNVKQVL